MKKEAFLAIVFASGILNPQLPAISDDKPKSTDSVIQGIANNSEMKPEFRAYYLLHVADRYLQGINTSAAEEPYKDAVKGPGWNWYRRNPDAMWIMFSDDISKRLSNSETDTIRRLTGGSHPVANENLLRAESAIDSALAQLDNTSDKVAKLNLYFVAARLSEKIGNAAGMRKCDKVLNDAFKSCEGSSPVDPEQIKAASSVLNSMAFGIVPIRIPDWNPSENVADRKVTSSGVIPEKDFKESEKLKQRAAAMADRLEASDDQRRMAHRNLALWYMQLGKTEKAGKEKQILFKLVGVQDDSILYPQSAGCGNVVWWRTEKLSGTRFCGMG